MPADSTFSESQLFAALIGAAAVGVVFLLGLVVQHCKEGKKRLRTEYAVLLIALNEATFYLKRLHQLSAELVELIDFCNDRILKYHVSHVASLCTPSYRIYPDILGQSKLDIAREIDLPELVRDISLLHFELSHIAERLETTKSQHTIAVGVMPMLVGNLTGFRGLVDLNIPRFEKCIALIDSELAGRKRKLDFWNLIDV